MNPYDLVIMDLKRRRALVQAAIKAVENLRPDLIPLTIIDLGRAAEETAALANAVPKNRAALTTTEGR